MIRDKPISYRIILAASILGTLLMFYDYPAATVWITTTFLFFPLFLLSRRQSNKILYLFFLLIWLTHTIPPTIMFINRDNYTETGWTAIGNFDFTYTYFLEIYTKLAVFYWLVYFGVSILEKKISSISIKEVLQNSTSTPVQKSSKRAQILLLVLTGIILYVWMYDNNIGITGMGFSQNYLPFRLGGFLYYLSRYLLPMSIAYLYLNSRHHPDVKLAIIALGLLSTFTQASKFTISILFLPLLWSYWLQKRHLLAYASALLYFVAYASVEISRNFIYSIEGNIVTKNPSLNLFDLLVLTITEIKPIGIIKAIAGLFSRIGGGQDVVLSYQYNYELFERTYLDELLRIFFGIQGNFDGNPMLHGFMPPDGFSVGAGGFSAILLQTAGPNIIGFYVLVIPITLLLYYGNIASRKISEKIGAPNMYIITSAMYVIILSASVNFYLVYLYIILLPLILQIKCFRIKPTRGVI